MKKQKIKKLGWECLKTSVGILQVGIFQGGVWWVGIFRVGVFLIPNKICVIHFSSSNEQNFVNLSQAADKDKKFEKIKQIAFKRLNQPDGSSCKFSERCANIPTTLMNHHGCHRDCY